MTTKNKTGAAILALTLAGLLAVMFYDVGFEAGMRALAGIGASLAVCALVALGVWLLIDDK